MSTLRTVLAVIVTCCTANFASAQLATIDRVETTYTIEILLGNWRTGEMSWVELYSTQSLDEAELIEEFVEAGMADGTIEDDLVLSWYLIVVDVRISEFDTFVGLTSGQSPIVGLPRTKAPTHKPDGYREKVYPWEE